MSEQVRVVERTAFDVWNEVPLVPQLTGMSCWAAAAAMIIGWRDVVPVDPAQVAAGAGRWEEYGAGLHPVELAGFARAWGLVVERQVDWSIDDLRRVLERYGPVWLGEASPGLHSIVITGMRSDGTPGGTIVRINDPWPVGRGERYTLTWHELMRNFRAATSIAGVHAQVLHAGGRRRGPSGSYRLHEKHTTRRSIGPVHSVRSEAMYATEQRARHHEQYAAATYALAVQAGTLFVDTTGPAADPLAGHGGSGENLALLWNEVEADAAAVDVVVHLHGYSARDPDGAMLRDKVAAAGLDLSLRTRPTLAVVPRGRKISASELAKNPKANRNRYTFPALTADGGAGLERLVNFALETFAQRALERTTGAPAVARLIITAHSGGGAPLNQLLAKHAQRAVCNPHEVHAFDALYGDVSGIASWVKARIAADRARSADDAEGGALRVIHRDGTAAQTAVLARALPAESDPLRAAYRAERTTVGHNDIPRTFGGLLLGDARADLAAPSTAQGLGAGAEECQDWGLPASAFVVREDIDGWLNAEASERARQSAERSAFIASTTRSAIELIRDASTRRRFLEEVDWQTQHFKGRGPNAAHSEALFSEMARVVPERRVPGSITYHELSAGERKTLPGSRVQLFTEACDSFIRMRDAAASDGVTLTVLSGWRSRAAQRAIADRNRNAAAVAQGISAHNYGLAADLALSVSGLDITEISTASMPNMIAMYRSPVYKWMALNGRDHGWFPYRREPWHWEYNPPGLKERFESRTSRGQALGYDPDAYGAPVGLMEHYRNAPPLAEAEGEVPGDIDPDLYNANSVGDVVRILGEWLSRRQRFTVGVQNTTIFPHSAICQLRMRLSGGGTALGTGFYIGRNRLLTAAHNLVIPGRTVQSIEVSPGRTNDMSTFGSFTVTGSSNWVVHPRYNGRGDFDLAVIKVTTPPPNGAFFPLEELRMSPISGIAVCGYAAEGTGIDSNRQNMDVDTIRDLRAETFTYALHARRGTSGSPTFYILGDRVKAVGVLSRTADRHTNEGCRLTDAKIAWIRGI